jgi:hypothetical protein
LTFNGLPQRCKMPEEKPSCRALQTLPQRCNFRCNKIYQHHTLIPHSTPTPKPIDTLNVKIESYSFDNIFSCLNSGSIWDDLVGTSSYSNASQYNGIYKKVKNIPYKVYLKEEISSNTTVLAYLVFVPISNDPNSGGWIFFNTSSTESFIINLIKTYLSSLISKLSVAMNSETGIAGSSGGAPCGTLYTFNKRYGPNIVIPGLNPSGINKDYGYAPFSNHDITNILSIPNIPMNSYWADANKRFPSFAGIQELGSNASGTGGWLDDAQWAPPGINWSPEPPPPQWLPTTTRPCPDSTEDCLGWPWPLYPNDPNINDYAANIKATMESGGGNSAITIDIKTIN